MLSINSTTEKITSFQPTPSPCINHAISKAIAYQSRTIRTPADMLVSIGEMTNFERYLFHKLKRKPSLEEIATEMGVSVDKVEKI